MTDMFYPGILFRAIAALLLGALAACSSKTPTPDWKINAHGAAERAVQAYFEGNARVERAEFARARSELSRTGDAAQLAKLELLRCAAQVASLESGPCARFEPLAADALAEERAYARYLAGKASVSDVSKLPEAQRTAAVAAEQQLVAAIAVQTDPFARLVAAGAAFARGAATPAVVKLAVDTASHQGWRRPLLAWLGVQIQLAERAGDQEEVARLRRRAAIAGQESAVE